MHGDTPENPELLRAFGIRMDTFEEQLEKNTEATARVEANTKELVDILTSWKGAMKVFEFVGKIAKPVGAIIIFLGTVWAMWKKP